MTTESTHPKPLPGILHVYDPDKRLVCFESGRTSSTTSSATSPSKNCVIFVGGLGDGLAAIPVLPELSHALHSIEEGGWSLIQVLTKSSYLGWTTGEVDRDVKDLITLEAYLRRQAGKTGKLVLMGHSTGCQDIVRLFQLHGHTTTYDASILQAPVSDREYAVDTTPPGDLETTVAAAKEQSKAGGGAFPLPWQALDIINEDQQYKDPISADRWLSLVTKGGKEDFFSSDLGANALEDIFAGLRNSKKPLLFLMSGRDECIPKHVNLSSLTDRFVKAASSESANVRGEILLSAGHSVEDEQGRKDLIRCVMDFVKSI